MTHRMRDVFEQRAVQDFVGRTPELTRLLSMLQQDSPSVAYVHGVGGIGKTSLLAAFGARARNQGTVVVRLDCRTIEPTETEFLHALGTATGGDVATVDDAAERLGALGKCVVFALDTYEVLRLMDTWVRQVLVPSLPDHVHAFLFGREPPVPAWLLTPGWQDLFHSIRLEPLGEQEATALLEKSGVPATDAGRINRFAHGHPLALKLAAAAMAERPSLDVAEVVSQRVVEELIRVYLSDIRDPLVREALDASSVVRRTTLSLLAAMLPQAAPQDVYERLRALPFVESGTDGLIVHDVVRESIAAALQAAEPSRYRRYRHAAWRQLRTELISAAKSDLWRYTADMVYQIENPVVRAICFPTDLQPVAVEPAQPGDGSRITAITEQHDGPAAAAIMERWWHRSPRGFHVVRERERPVAGYYCMLDPTELERADVEADPVVLHFSEHLRAEPLPRRQGALYLRRWLSEDDGEGPGIVQGACWVDFKRAYLERQSYLRRVYLAACDPAPYAPVMSEVGFRPLDGEAQVDGRAFVAAALDFGPSLVMGWLSSLVDAQLGIERDDLLDVEARELIVEGERVQLTRLEFQVMQYLHQRETRVATRPALLHDVWGIDFDGSSNVVDVIIRQLRKKLGPQAVAIETVTGMGYRYRRPDLPVAPGGAHA